jgi:thiol-disulfide isomerase/thioredoxin
VSVEVIEAGEVDDEGRLIPYTFATSGDDEGTWTLEEKSSYDRVDVHFDKTDERAVFYVTYTIDGVVARWGDTGELYWKFVGDNWDQDSLNVECNLFFAGAPEGTKLTAGENIRGWLHNRSLNGTIEVPSGVVPAWDDMAQGDPGTVSATLSKVRSDEFAEVRVAFPAEWLSSAKQRSEARLDTILTEEAGWADAANARFERVEKFATIKKWVYTIMGALSAVLAGACVAPVLVSVLLLTAELYSKGETFVVALPFLLGIGMALPWPFAGAGLKVLPKPGKWMKWVNRFFAVAVFAFAGWYGRLAYRGFVPSSAGNANGASSAGIAMTVDNFSLEGLKRPVLVDCWASWCKNCAEMDKVLADEKVRSELGRFTFVKLQAEDIGKLKALAGFESAKGLPMFVIFE